MATARLVFISVTLGDTTFRLAVLGDASVVRVVDAPAFFAPLGSEVRVGPVVALVEADLHVK